MIIDISKFQNVNRKYMIDSLVSHLLKSGAYRIHFKYRGGGYDTSLISFHLEFKDSLTY